MTHHEFVDAVVTYGLMTGASVTSWGRTKARNSQVGGVPVSAHRAWLAVDVVYDTPVPEGVEIGRRLGLRVLPEGDHDHLQPLDWSAG